MDKQTFPLFQCVFNAISTSLGVSEYAQRCIIVSPIYLTWNCLEICWHNILSEKQSLLKQEPFSDPTVADSLRFTCKATRNRFHRKKKQGKKKLAAPTSGGGSL